MKSSQSGLIGQLHFQALTCNKSINLITGLKNSLSKPSMHLASTTLFSFLTLTWETEKFATLQTLVLIVNNVFENSRRTVDVNVCLMINATNHHSSLLDANQTIVARVRGNIALHYPFHRQWSQLYPQR